jgi:hypothetical protein
VTSYKRMSAEVKAAKTAGEASFPFVRPTVRRHCEPCVTCQAVRDGELDMSDDLPCGHTGDEVIWHSRPCIFVGCRPNLYLDVTENGSLKFTRPELEPEQMRPTRSCVLDIANQGPLTLDDVGHAIDVSRERIRQIEVKAMVQQRSGLEASGIDEDMALDFPDREQGYENAADESTPSRRK